MDNLQILFDAPVLSLQLLIDGLLVGAIFALVAYGLALVWGVMNIINVAQGEFVMLGGYIAYFLYQSGMHPMYGIPVAAVALYILGWALYRTVIFRIVDRDLFTSLLATFGLSILLQQLANELFGADVRTAESGLGTWLLFDGLVTVSQVKVVAFAVALLIGIALLWFLKRSRVGQAIRATAQNARAARVMGVDTNRIYAATYGLNAAICGAAGALVSMIWIIHPYLGLPYTARAFMIVVVAGLGQVGAVLVAGMGLGVAEGFAGFILGAQFQSGMVFALLVLILVWRRIRLARQRRYLS